jgi:hypothetical protein
MQRNKRANKTRGEPLNLLSASSVAQQVIKHSKDATEDGHHTLPFLVVHELSVSLHERAWIFLKTKTIDVIYP